MCKSHGVSIQGMVLSRPLGSCVALGKLYNLSVPRVPHLQGD